VFRRYYHKLAMLSHPAFIWNAGAGVS